MAAFEPVWITTSEHLSKFYAIYKQTSPLAQFFGAYGTLEGFPHVHMYWGIFSFFRFPMVLIANGRASINAQGLDFKSTPMILPGSKVNHLRTDLNFYLPAGELVSVERQTITSPVMQYYNIPFTRIHSRSAGLLSDFLVCAGGSGPFMGKIKSRSEELFIALEELTRPA